MKRRNIFYLAISSLGLIIGIADWLMYSSSLPFMDNHAVLAALETLPIVFFIGNSCANALPRGLSRLLAIIGGYWMVFFYYSTLLLIGWLLLFAATTMLCSRPLGTLLLKAFTGCGLAVILLALTYGTINALHITCRRLTIHTNKPLAAPVTIAFISDIHLGMILGTAFSRHLVHKINALAPDAVIIGGDTIDGNLEFVLREQSYRSFADLKAPQGCWAVYGNHDYYSQQTEAEETALSTCGIHFLRNKRTILAGCIALTGLDDYLYHPQKKVMAPAKDLFNIIADHEPWRIKLAAEAGYDLYLGGHTHAGQFFPNRLVTKRLYDLDYGCRTFGQLTAVVSNGCGFWGSPTRIGPSPEIVLLTIASC